MKKNNLFFILLILIVNHAAALKQKNIKPDVNSNIESNQIWTFTFYEFSLLREKQKSEFAEMLLLESEKNTILKDLFTAKDPEGMKTVLESSSKWDQVEFKINKACADKLNFITCIKIAQLRHDILDKYRAHK